MARDHLLDRAAPRCRLARRPGSERALHHHAVAPAPELVADSGQHADALEAANKIKTAGRDDIAGLTQQVTRLADALDTISAVLGCVTESVESDADGVTRCYVRTRDDNHGFFLGQRDERLHISIGAGSTGVESRTVTVVPHGARWAGVGLRSWLTSHTL